MPRRTGRSRAPGSGACPAAWIACRSCSSSSFPGVMEVLAATGSSPLLAGAGPQKDIKELTDADLAAVTVALPNPIQNIEPAVVGAAHWAGRHPLTAEEDGGNRAERAGARLLEQTK